MEDICNMRRRSLLEGTKDYGDIITINQNISDPDTMITGDINGSEIQKIVENTHKYMCKYLGEEEGMLICRVENDKYSDGTLADNAGEDGDIMIRLPKSSIRCISDDADVMRYEASFNKNQNNAIV